MAKSNGNATIAMYSIAVVLIVSAFFIPWFANERSETYCEDTCMDINVKMLYRVEDIRLHMDMDGETASIDFDYKTLKALSDSQRLEYPDRPELEGTALVKGGYIALIVGTITLGITSLLAGIGLMGEPRVRKSATGTAWAAVAILSVAIVLLAVGMVAVDSSLRAANEYDANELGSGMDLQEDGLTPHAAIFVAPFGVILIAVGALLPQKQVIPQEAWTEPPRRMKCPRCAGIVSVPHGHTPHCQQCGFR